LNEFGENITLQKADDTVTGLAEVHPVLFRISDATGVVTFNTVTPPTKESLSSQDAFLLDYSTGVSRPAIFVWIGKEASLNESRLALQYAQHYLYDKKIKAERVRVTIPIVKMKEGEETSEFLQVI
jgi:gelsolin